MTFPPGWPEQRIPEWPPFAAKDDPPPVKLLVTEREYEALMVSRRAEVQAFIDQAAGREVTQ